MHLDLSGTADGSRAASAETRRRARAGEDSCTTTDYLRYAYATIDAIAPDAQTSSRAV